VLLCAEESFRLHLLRGRPVPVQIVTLEGEEIDASRRRWGSLDRARLSEFRRVRIPARQRGHVVIPVDRSDECHQDCSSATRVRMRVANELHSADRRRKRRISSEGL